MPIENPYSFEDKIEKLENSTYYVVYLPANIQQNLPQDKRLRTLGKLNGVDFDLAIHKRKTSPWFFMLGSGLMKKAKVKFHSVVKISFTLYDPNQVNIPEEMFEVLEQDPQASEMFYAFTPGIQRSLCHYVISAKNIDTKIKRALELAEKIKSESLHIQRQNKT